MTYQVAFLTDTDDPDGLLDWLAAAACERFGYVPTFALTGLVEDTFPDEWAEAQP